MIKNIPENPGLETLNKAGITVDAATEAIRVRDDQLSFGAFGGLKTFELLPYISLTATAGTPERFTETFTSGPGSSAGATDNNPGMEFKVQTGTTVGGYGVIRSKKVLSYRPGIGSVGRWTARYTTPVANSIQRTGLFNIGNELTVGYDGTQFGFLRRTGGRPEIRLLTLTQRATSSQTATITLNGVAFNASVTNSTIQQNAYEIATGVSFTGWTAYNVGSTIYFQSSSVGTKSNSYSLTSTGDLAGTFSQSRAGAAVNDNWTYQSAWNITTLSSASDPFILDPTKGNIYQIQLQYLGYGAITLSLENPNTGSMVPVHRVQYANSNTTTSVDLPQFKLGIIAASAGSTTNLAVYSGSMAGFHENAARFPYKPHSAIRTVSSVTTTLTNVLALKKISVVDSRLLISDVIMNHLTCACEGTKPVQFEVRLNPTFSTPVLWEQIDEDTPIVATNGGGAITNGEPIFAMSLGKSSSINIELSHLDLVLSTDDVVSLCAQTTAATSDITASMTWSEI